MRYAIRVGIDNLPIEEDEIPKILQAMSDKSIVVLSCGIIRGTAIGGIIRDINADFDLNQGHKIDGTEGILRKDLKTDLPDKIKSIKLLLELSPGPGGQPGVV